MRLIEAGLLALAVILCLLMVFRPLVLRIAMAQPKLAGAVAGVAGADATLEGSTPDAIAGGLPGTAAISADANELVRLANVEGELRVASLRRVTDLVASHPDETLAMVRNWLTHEEDR